MPINADKKILFMSISPPPLMWSCQLPISRSSRSTAGLLRSYESNVHPHGWWGITRIPGLICARSDSKRRRRRGTLVEKVQVRGAPSGDDVDVLGFGVRTLFRGARRLEEDEIRAGRQSLNLCHAATWTEEEGRWEDSGVRDRHLEHRSAFHFHRHCEGFRRRWRWWHRGCGWRRRRSRRRDLIGGH